MSETVVATIIVVAVAIVVASLFLSIFLVISRRGSAPTPDNVPTRLGVILLGAIGLTCIGGLFYLSNAPDLSESEQASGNAQPPSETALLQAQAPEGVTGAVVNSTNEAVKNAATDASALGLSGQIIGLLGTIAGASVAGIAGLLVGPGKTETQPQPLPSGEQTSSLARSTDFLRELAKQRDEGLITDSDFDRMKRLVQERFLAEAERTSSSASPAAVTETLAQDAESPRVDNPPT